MLGFKIQKLQLMPIGFGISFRIDTKNYNKKILKANLLAIKKIIIALAGPTVNLVFILLFISLENIFNINLDKMIYANILIFLFNMLMIYPLDGGRILKNILYILFGKIISLKVTNIISNIVTVILTFFSILAIIFFHNILYILVLIYIWIIVINENKLCSMKIKMYKILKNYIAINQD